MKGLLLKDYIMLKSQWVMYLLLVILWLAVGFVNGSAAFFSGVMQMLAVMVPLTLAAYDEKNGWESFALTMPVLKRQMVSARFFMMLLVLLFVGLLTLAGTWILSRDLPESGIAVMLSLPVGLSVNCLLLPILFRFGVEKGKFVFLGATAVFILSGFLVGKLPIDGLLVKLLDAFFYFEDVLLTAVMLWVGALLLLAISWLLSVRIYEKKEF